MRYLSITVAVIAAIFISTMAMAQQHGQGVGGGMKGAHSGLTDEQQTTLTALQKDHQKTILPLVLELRAKQAELDVLLVASKLDNSKVASVNKEIDGLHGKILTEKTNFRRQVFELTGNLISGDGNGSGEGKCGMMKKGGGMGMGSQSMMHKMMPSNADAQHNEPKLTHKPV